MRPPGDDTKTPAAGPDYGRIEKAIRFLEDHWRDQPDLDEVARAAHLSPFHFQRLFTRWAGVSPKRFLQFLTIGHAQKMLEEGASVLDAALDTGLSGPSRLHDLFVTFDAITPGDVKRRGAGLDIRYGVHDSPFGEMLIGATERGICRLSFLDGTQGPSLVEEMAERWPGARLHPDPAGTAALVERIFGGRGDPLRLHVPGTNFQIKVWEAILHLPPGRLATYAQIGRAIGHPKAARAVGNALNANPVAFLIPCHAVIPRLQRCFPFANYRYGTTRRAAILGWEAAKLLGDGQPESEG